MYVYLKIGLNPMNFSGWVISPVVGLLQIALL